MFEVHTRPSQHDEYLRLAKMLRPELEQIAGLVEHVRYASLTRDGWMLSLSGPARPAARTRVDHPVGVLARVQVYDAGVSSLRETFGVDLARAEPD